MPEQGEGDAMTTDLWMLLAAAGLQWALIMATAGPQILKNGIGWAAGNREKAETPEPAGWVGRCQRCSSNMQENLTIFAILVLVAQVAGQADAMTANGAMVFVGARVAHAVIYVAGVPFLRTGAWVVSIVGMGMILAGILS